MLADSAFEFEDAMLAINTGLEPKAQNCTHALGGF
jgi:hypothetical protein